MRIVFNAEHRRRMAWALRAPGHLQRSALTLVGVLVLGGCADRQPLAPLPDPDAVRAKIVRLMPVSVSDRQGWATDIYAAFAAQQIAPSNENLCSVLAVTVQESTFQASPPVPGLAKIARKEVDRRAASLRIPGFVVNAALGIRSASGKSFGERLTAVRTEQELSDIFDEFINQVPLGRQLFGGFNPVRTGGPMQVSIAFAEAQAADYPYVINGSIRDEVFSRRGGMYFGIAHLLGYPANYPEPLYRFADFNAGWYASRNAAFQQALSRASGIPLTLDGDLIIHGSRTAGATERAARTLAARLKMSEVAIRSDLEKGDSLAFEASKLYRRLYELAESIDGKPLPRAVLPGITLESPKITRTLTTAWFAKRVDERYRRCMAQATGG